MKLSEYIDEKQWVERAKARVKIDIETTQKCIDDGLLDDLLEGGEYALTGQAGQYIGRPSELDNEYTKTRAAKRIKKKKKGNITDDLRMGIYESTYYRGGGTGSIPKGKTAKDVLDYEKYELGNNDIVVQIGIDPSKIKSDNLIWVTKNIKSAKRYGDIEKVEYNNAKIIAKDSDGGILLDINESIEAMQDLSAYHPGLKLIDDKTKKKVKLLRTKLGL